MTGPWRLLDGPAGALRVYCTAGTSGADRDGLIVLCHELPRMKGGALDSGRTFPALADRMAQESRWRVATATLRGAGGSDGDFSASGWLDDLRFVLAQEITAGEKVCLVGFGFGGALALRLAAGDHRVASVAVLGTPDDLAVWVEDPGALVGVCRSSGTITSPGYPPDLGAWSRELVDLGPLGAVSSLEDRPLLVMHGADDPDVPLAAARALAAATAGPVELRIVPGAGHWLRADPRVVATLIGWLERQR